MQWPEIFRIELPKAVYFPGETIEGHLNVVTRSPITCKGIRVQLQGKGSSFIVIGHGKHREIKTSTQYYVYSKQTVWGHVYKTPVLNSAGANAVFGTKYSPDQGVLFIHCTREESLSVIFRAMDYDWGKKDDLLGEAVVSLPGLTGLGPVSLTLQTKGKKEGASVINLSVHEVVDPAQLSAYYFDPSRHHGSSHCCYRVQVHSATNLKSAEWFGGKNDVYIQAYPSDGPVDITKAFPPPNEKVTLPPTNARIPFRFMLPSDLPSSFVARHDGRNFISYCIYANLDVAFKMDPSSRCFFTILQPHASICMPYPTMRATSISASRSFCCFSLRNLGVVTIGASSDRSCYCPGETAYIQISVNVPPGSGEDIVTLSNGAVSLNSNTTCSAQGYSRWFYHSHVTVGVNNAPNGSPPVAIQIPALVPSFSGGGGVSQNIMGGMSSASGRDPVRWDYYFHVTFHLQEPGICAPGKYLHVNIPVVIGSVGLAATAPYTAQFMSIPVVTTAPPAVPALAYQQAPGNAPGQVSPESAPNVQLSLSPPDWRGIGPMGYVLPNAFVNASPVPYDAFTLIKDEEEDQNTPAENLRLQPVIYTFPDVKLLPPNTMAEPNGFR